MDLTVDKSIGVVALLQVKYVMIPELNVGDSRIE